jgi:RNA polymerase sigma factor (sigma-70 family)
LPDDSTRVSLLLRLRDPSAEDAWREFDTIYRPMLTRIAMARGLGTADVEDVVQHCMVAVAQHIKTFDYDPQKGRFKGWLCTLVNNRIRNLHRDRRETEADSDVFRIPQQRESAPEEIFERIWMEEHLRYALRDIAREIKPEALRAFERLVLENASVEQVCGDMKLTANQLYKIKWRVMQKLQERMRDLTGEELAADETPPGQ